ncbi:cytochrome P450 4F1-like [Saccostrea echinata]|uniref:cytochrome P450 4F1-like n=1 Tax=Saccostrea echinata TaxID=191078 RepID=UPI002A826954|nr:cytochrome P450 4F1-like [Saccostrea echinata]
MAVLSMYRILRENWLEFAVVGLVTCGVILILTLVVRAIQLRYAFKGFPEPEGKHWLLGHMKLFLGKGGSNTRLQRALQWTAKYPKFFITYFGPLRVACTLNHPDTVKVLLKGADPKPAGFGEAYRHALPWLGEGLLIAGGKRWARSRRLLTPAFHFDILKPYICVYRECAGLLEGNIERFAKEEKSFEVFSQVCLCTLDIILRCAFSYQTNCQTQSGEVHPYVKAVNEIADLWFYRNRTPWLYPDFIYYNTEEGKRFLKNCNYVHNVATEVMEKRRKELETVDLTSKRYLDFLDILLTAKDEKGVGLSDEEIRNEVDTFLFEGHDTTASAISWILYSLSQYPEYQRECQKEIDQIISESEDGEIGWEDLGKLPFLTQCIKEGMRLHCPVPFIARSNTAPITIEGHKIPAGTNLVANIWCLHHNPMVWGQDHMEYKPERFSKENLAKMDSFAFLPFSAGPRNCIGQHFAMNEEKIVLAKLLHRFSFSLDKDHEVEHNAVAVMRALNGIQLYAKER